MKNILIVLLSMVSLVGSAQTKVASTISTVKVYSMNAEITRELAVNLSPGTQEIILTGVSTKMIPSSLQVQFRSSTSSLLSATYKLDFLDSATGNDKVESLQAKLVKLNEDLAWIDEQKTILQGMINILNTNQQLGGTTTGFTPQQVIALTDTYKSKSLEIKKELFGLNKEHKKMSEEKLKIEAQLNEMKATQHEPSGNIVLQIASKASEKSTIKCIYNVSNAGWIPLYDLRSNGIDENVRLNYKANVFQNTGQDWNNVKVIISTGNPTQDNNRPILTPLYANITPTVNGANKMRGRSMAIWDSNSNMAYSKPSANSGEAFSYNAQMASNQLNVEFEVMDKQTILSDGNLNLMALNTYELNTEYIYHAVPKLNDGAFLLAKISNWGQYNLLDGEANIFFEGAFVGNSFINPSVTADTLLISMGRDNNINIQRKAVKEYTSSKMIGLKKELSFGYEITVLNKKPVSIDIEILDQIPVSQNSLLDISLDEKGSATYNSENGKLLWTHTIKPGQSIMEKFAYTVKYPKKESVSGIK